MSKQKTKAFTLVELIVVITILAILGTIAFISMSNYARDARDSSRLADVGIMSKSVEFYQVKEGSYPAPSNAVTMTYSGSEVWNQGFFGKSVLQAGARASQVPVDPLLNTEYIYSVLNTGGEYQIATVLEGGSPYAKSIIPGAYAADGITGTMRISGNYNGQVAKAQSGSTTYILAVPTIINGDTTLTDVQTIVTTNKLVYNNLNNLPSTYSGTTFDVPTTDIYSPSQVLVYSGTLDSLTEQANQVALLDNLQTAYSGSTLVSENTQIANIVNSDSSSSEALPLVQTIIKTNINPDVIVTSTTSGGSSGSSSTTFLKQVGETGIDYSYKVKKDSSGNIYVLGQFSGTNIDIFGISKTSVLANPSGNAALGLDIFIAKLDSSGNTLWVKTAGGPSEDIAYDLDIDSSGNVYISGRIRQSSGVDLFGNTVATLGKHDMFLVKLNSSGTSVWYKKYGAVGSTGVNQASSLAIDNSGNIYVSGQFSANENVFGTVLTHLGGGDTFIAKLNSAGTELWSKGGGGTGYDVGTSLDTDSSGNVYAIGLFSNTADIFTGISDTISAGGYDTYFTKLDSNGNSIWKKSIGGLAYDLGQQIHINSSGEVYILGMFGYAASTDLFGTIYNVVGGLDGYVSRVSPSTGAEIWTKMVTGSGNDQIYGLASNGNGISIGGDYQSNPATVFGETKNLNGTTNMFISKLDNNGNVISSTTSTSGDSQIRGIAIAADGSYYITGHFKGTSDIFGNDLISNGNYDVFLSKLNSSLTY